MKRRIVFIAVFMLCITMIFIVKSYALFETNGEATNELAIGKWTIYINDANVTFSDTINLNYFTYHENDHVRPGYLAPGTGGDFSIILDARDTEVSMICNLEMDDEELDDHPNMWVDIKDASKTNLLDDEKNYQVIINHDDTVKYSHITYELHWTNNDVDDEADTHLIGQNININFDVHCEQYLGE